MDPKSTSLPQVTILIENPKKSSNWGPLLRCCAAFGISKIFVVGFDKCSVQGSHGASKHVELIAFPSHAKAIETLQSLDFQLVGLLQGVPKVSCDNDIYSVVPQFHEEKQEMILKVDMTKERPGKDERKSFPVQSRPFFHHTCFVVSKKTNGLPLSLSGHCAQFVHIPHFGIELEAGVDESSWLTVEAGLSIVLHEFSLWAEYDKESTIYEGQKYDVLQKVKGTGPDQEARQIRVDRQKELNDLADEAEGCLGTLLADGDGESSGDY